MNKGLASGARAVCPQEEFVCCRFDGEPVTVPLVSVLPAKQLIELPGVVVDSAKSPLVWLPKNPSFV